MHGSTELQLRLGGVPVVRREPLQRTPIAEPVVLQVGRYRGGLEEQFGDAQRAPAEVVHHRRVGLRAETIGEDAPLRDLDDTVLVAERPLAREGKPHEPIQEHRIGAHHRLQRAQRRHPGRGDGHPVLWCQVVIGDQQPDPGGLGRDGVTRHPQVPPGGRRAQIGE
ncbi:Uncharacterised protein [Mycobacteroides abscessus subsp. abscessus]|nr:Uncharacterised protein [Mycobacteroides abscessus subsp. abscessus]